MDTITPGKIIICSAPSGAGKSTLINHLLKEVPGCIYSISATTRKPRPKERDGISYFFMTEIDFKDGIDKGLFAEWQMVHGNYYGTPRAFVDSTISSGKHLVMDIDVKGRKMFGEAYTDAIGILILPPSLEELELRLRRRKTESEKDILIRLENARAEIKFAEENGGYRYTIINDDLNKAKNEIVRITRQIIGE